MKIRKKKRMKFSKRKKILKPRTKAKKQYDRSSDPFEEEPVITCFSIRLDTRKKWRAKKKEKKKIKSEAFNKVEPQKKPFEINYGQIIKIEENGTTNSIIGLNTRKKRRLKKWEKKKSKNKGIMISKDTRNEPALYNRSLITIGKPIKPKKAKNKKNIKIKLRTSKNAEPERKSFEVYMTKKKDNVQSRIKKNKVEFEKYNEQKLVELKNKDDHKIYIKSNKFPMTYSNNDNSEEYKTSYIVKKDIFLEEELEFLKEENLNTDDFHSKWSWISKELSEKYFVSVILPYYIIKPKIKYSELKKLGFGAFLSKILREKGFNYSNIKNKYLAYEINDLVDFLSKRFGEAKFNEKLVYARKRLEDIEEIPSDNAFYESYKKAILFFDYYNCKCNDCGVGFIYLPTIQLHHYGKKRYSWRKLKKMNIEDANKILNDEEAYPLCENCHLKRQASRFYEFIDIIMMKDLFSFSTDERIDLIEKHIIDHPKYKNTSYRKKAAKIESIKYWVKKRYLIETFFDGKCPCCGIRLDTTNLPIFILHHLKIILLNKHKWNRLRHFSVDKIVQIFKKERIIIICANCHNLYHSTFPDYTERLINSLPDYFPSTEKFTNISKINELYNNIKNSIDNFNLSIYNRDYKTLFKLPISQQDVWKKNLIYIYQYLKLYKLNWFFINNFNKTLNLAEIEGYRIVDRLLTRGYIKPIDTDNTYQTRYTLTELGNYKAVQLKKIFPKISSEIKNSIKDTKKSYDHKISNKDLFSDILIKYTYNIYNIMLKKDYNEFIASELAELINKSVKTVRLHLKDKLIKEGLLELTQFPLTTIITTNTEVYKLTSYGFDLLERRFPNLTIKRDFKLNIQDIKNRIAFYIFIIGNIITERGSNEFSFLDILNKINVTNSRSSKGREAEGILLKHLKTKGYVVVLENFSSITLSGKRVGYKLSNIGLQYYQYVQNNLS